MSHKLKRFETGFVGSATGNPATLGNALEKTLEALELTGEVARTITLDNVDYQIPSTVALLDNAGSTATAYYCKRKSDNTTGTVNLVTGVFTASSFTAGNELPLPTNTLGVRGVGTKTENLFNKTDITTGYRLSAYLGFAYGTKGQTTTIDFYEDSGYYCSHLIPVNTGEVYVKNSPIEDVYHRFKTYNGNKISVRKVDTNSITIEDGEMYIAICGLQTELDTTMVAQNSLSSSYIPYGYKFPIKHNNTTTYTTYASEPLYKVGTYADELNAVEGKINRGIGKVAFDGTETWVYDSTYSRFRVSISDVVQLASARTVPAYCTHFNVLSNQESISSIVAGQAYFGDTRTTQYLYFHASQTSVSDWTTWLATQAANGESVTVYYPLATATEEGITALNILLSKGTNYLECDTEVTGDLSVEFRTKVV